jgi:hypothetical protein
MKHIITITKKIEVFVDVVPNTDYSLIRASWEGERKKVQGEKKQFHGCAFVKSKDVDKILKKLTNPEDLEKYNTKVSDPQKKDYVRTIALVKPEYIEDMRILFRKDEVRYQHWMDGDIPSDVVPVFECWYDHSVYDLDGKYLINKYSDSILSKSGWKLKKLIDFAETVDWLEFAVVNEWGTCDKIDWVRGNGDTAYPTITAEPEVIESLRGQNSWSKFEALLAHKIGPDAVAEFKGPADWEIESEEDDDE